MTIDTHLIDYTIDGESYDGFLALPSGATGPLPAVMVCHAWGGRSDHEENAARTLAEAGYMAFAADVYGKGKRGATTAECEALMTPLASNRPLLQHRLVASLAAMTGHEMADSSQAAIIGYCFGGLCALDLARGNAPIQGSVAFHAILGAADPNDSTPITPKVLALQGYDDPMADASEQAVFAKEMTARGADWQLHLYGGVAHAFTNVGANDASLGLKYDEVAAARAWGSCLTFLSETIGA